MYGGIVVYQLLNCTDRVISLEAGMMMTKRMHLAIIKICVHCVHNLDCVQVVYLAIIICSLLMIWN